MPWFGELMSKKMTPDGGSELQVDFYDDSRKEETKTTRVFKFVPGTTFNQAKQDVTAAGQELKTKYSLFDQFNVGQKITL